MLLVVLNRVAWEHLLEQVLVDFLLFLRWLSLTMSL